MKKDALKPAKIATPTLQLDKPLTGKAKQLAMQEEAKARATVAADAAAMDAGAAEGKANFIARTWRAITTRTDKSYEGLKAATFEAVAFANTIEWLSADDMCEEIEEQIATRINADHGIVVKFVGVHKEDRRPRLLVFTTWGHRLACRGAISFGALPKA